MADKSNLLNSVRDTIFRINKKGVILDFYAHKDTELWMDREEIIGMDVSTIPTIQNAKKHINRCLKTQEVAYFQFSLVVNEKERHFQTRLEPINKEELHAVTKEITAKKRAEHSLRQSEKKFNILYNSSLGMFNSLDKEGLVLDVGDYLLEKMGYKREEIVGRHAFSFLSKSSQNYAAGEVLPLYLQQGYCKDVPLQFVKKDGGLLDVLLSAIVIKDDQGKFEKTLVAFNDITQLRSTEQSLKASEEKFRHIFYSITDIYYKTNKEREITIISPSVEKISGYTPEELVGRPTTDFLSKKRARHIYKQLQLVGKITNYPIDFKLRSGEVRTFSVNAQIDYDKDGQYMGTTGLMRDITERKQVEEKITEVARRYHDLFEYGNDAIFIADSKMQNILDANKKAEELLGYSREEMLHLNLIDIRPASDRQDFKQRLLRLKKQGHLISEAVLQRKDGTVLDVEYSARIIEVDGKSLYQSFVRDITKRKQEENISRLNKSVLELIAREDNVQEVLMHTCIGVEKIFPDLICSILLHDPVNNVLIHGAAPSLPKYYIKAIDNLEIGPESGSCGTAAHFRKEVIVEDIASDPKWEAGQEVAARAKLKSCTSTPILSAQSDVLGTFAVYGREIGAPSKKELETIRNLGYLLSVAIENSRNKEALVASERRYRTLVNDAPVAIIIHTQGVIKFANKEALRIGHAKDESDVLGKMAMDFVAPDFKEIAQQRLELVQEQGSTPRSEQQFRRVDGTIVDVEVMGNYITFLGKPSVQIVFYDITERKETERKLIESENRYRQLVEHAPIGIIIHDTRRIRYVNLEMLKMAKATQRDQLEGREILDFVPEKFKDIVKKRISHVPADRGMIPRQEQQFICVDGSLIDIDVAGTPITLQGETLIQSAFYDITEKKNAVQRLIESEEQYRSLNDSISDAIIIANKKGHIISWNYAAEKIFGHKESEVLGKPASIIVPDKYLKGHTTAFRHFYESKKRNVSKGTYVFEGLSKDGSIFPVEISMANWKAGGEVYVSALIRDISERKTAEDRQSKLNDFLIKQNKQLEEFAHIASHNLRAPISNIEALLKLHELDHSPENTEFVLGQLGVVSDNLNDTINDLTEVIKTSWELNKQKQNLSFSEVCQKVLQSMSRAIINTDAKIDLDFDGAPEIWYPKVYLESILQNMLSNALKYRHPKRKPVIKVKTWKKDGNTVLQIEDNGLGINLEKHGSKLFGLRKTFHKNEDARGVGLFITKTQVESMGGSIDVTSKVEQGSVFVINFGEM